MNKISLKFLLFVTLFWLVASSSGYEYGNPYNLVGRGLFTRLHYLPPPEYSTKAPAEDQWFEQRLDHFNALNTDVWMQRYVSRYDYKNYVH